MKLSKYIIIVITSLVIHQAIAQDYPKGYFMFPIKPGQVNYLAGSMGELRTNHFHGGIDVKTEGKIGIPIHASADGYVSRISVSSYGYGSIVFITHPNGLVTTYAHLEKFNKPIGDYVVKKQYELESFDVDLYPAKNEIKVTKGEVIALSGNSGSSGGPHLHYEVRDTSNNMINPLLFGFSEIHDMLPPLIQKIALKTLTIDSRVNNEFGITEYKAAKTGAHYTIPATFTAYGTLGLEIKVHDKMNFTHNYYGIARIEVFLDDNKIFTHNINKFEFKHTRYINAHIDYGLFMQKGTRLEKCYISDGDPLTTYTTDANKGKIIIKDSLLHEVKVKVYDAYDNEATAIFKVRGKAPKTPTMPVSKTTTNQKVNWDIFENTLKLSTPSTGNVGATLYIKSQAINLPLAHYTNGIASYLYDLRKGLPDSAIIGKKIEYFNFVKPVVPGKASKINYKNMEVDLHPNALADTLYMQINNDPGDDETYIVNSLAIPVFDTLNIKYTPITPYPDTTHYRLYLLDRNNRPEYEGGNWNQNRINLFTRNMGKFSLRLDTIAPVIKLLHIQGNSISFHIADNFSGIGSFKATINGNWLLMNYDHKRHLIWSERLDKTVPLHGDFKLEVTDNSGNRSIFEIKL